MVNILVFEKSKACKHFPLVSKPTIAIRCMSSVKHRLSAYELLNGDYVGILPLIFDDVRNLKDVKGCIVFEDRHARKIKNFVNRHAGRFEEIMVHCDAGASRSVAVGAALGDFYGWNYDSTILDRHYDGPNPIVYNSLMKVLREN